MNPFRSITSMLPRTFVSESSEYRTFTGIGTLWLSDISGIGNLCEGMALEPVARALNAAPNFQAMCIQDNGGVIITSIGDAILAVWEPSQLTPSHAQLALEAAKKALAGHREVRSETGIEFHLRIALATGRMTGDWVGGRFQIVGAPYAVAQRLHPMNISHRSQLLYTSETLEYTSQNDASEPIGSVKGTSGNDVPVFEFNS